MRLSSDQQAAVQTRASLAVTAGAGTGKTHLLAERYLFHLVEEQLSPLEVVAITFTRRAAGELRARIRHQVTTRLPGEEELLAEIEAAPIGTIHSLCARICRDHPHEAGLPADFAILDEIGARLANPELIDQALDEMGPEIEAIGEAIPFSLLRELLRRLVSDPVTATQAFTVALGSGGSAERLLEQWADLGRQATELTLRELTAREDWRDAIATLRSQSGGAGDLIENLRREVLDLAADVVNNTGRVAQIGSLQLRGGSAKNWSAGQLETVKSALKVVRDAALKADRRCQNYQISPADQQLALLLPPLHTAFTQVMARLSLARRRSRLVDYAGLEEGAWRALQVERVRAHYQRRWRAFLVDEFQDTNQIQADILARLSAQARLTIVGDENQSIYGFRRAEVAVFERFRAEIIKNGGSTHRLSVSFRSHTSLIGGLNRIFAKVQGAEHQPLAARREPVVAASQPLRCLTVDAAKGVSKPRRQQTEARTIAALIRQMLAEQMPVHDRATGATRPITPADIAIISRTWRPLDAFGEALNAIDIPTANMGGGDLLRTREAMDLAAMVRFLANPEDDLALLAILRSPFFALSDRALQLEAERRTKGVGWWSLLSSTSRPELAAAAGILQRLLDLRQTTGAEMLLRQADRLTGYSAVLAGLPNRSRRLADWQAFLELVRDEERAVGGDIFALWRRLRRLLDREIALPRPSIEAGQAVSLLTIHAAKGLEWPVVIVPDLSSGRSDNDRRLFFDPRLGVAFRIRADEGDEKGDLPVLYAWLVAAQEQRELAESRRLLYVALTRARDQVILSAADRQGGLLDQLIPGLEAAGVVIETVEGDSGA